jgi:hypothetical protein
MDAAIEAINDTISYKHRNGRLAAGAVVVLHPFLKPNFQKIWYFQCWQINFLKK